MSAYCTRHLPVLTYSPLRAMMRRRRCVYLMCWCCDGKWGPLTADEAIKMWRMIDAVTWRTERDA